VRGGPRARRTPPEGAFSPRARRTSLEGVLSPRARRISPEGALSLERGGPHPRRLFGLVALVIRGGHQGRDWGMCAFWLRGLVCVLCFFVKLDGLSPVV
jgi:hypothetical protein